MGKNSNATDMYSATSWLWMISRIFGLCAEQIQVTTITTQKENERPRILTIFWRTYTIAILLAALYFAYRFQRIGLQPVVNVNKIIQLADELTAIFNISTLVIAIVYNFIHKNTLGSILQEFVKVETDLQKNLDVDVSYWFVRYVLKCGLVTIGLAAVFSALALLSMPLQHGDGGFGWESTQGWICYYIFINITDLNMLQFLAIVSILRTQLKTLLDQQISVQHDGATAQRPGMRKIKRAQLLEDQLLCFKRSSRTLYEISLRVNAVFSVPLFFSMANSFVSLFSGMYFSLFGFVYGKHVFKPRSLGDYVPTAVLLLRHFVKLISVAVLCENIQSIRRSLGWALHDADVEIDGRETKLKQNMAEYSMQLMHEKITFSASGFFDINSNVLQMIISSVTIYLVILIQFDMAEQEIKIEQEMKMEHHSHMH